MSFVRLILAAGCGILGVVLLAEQPGVGLIFLIVGLVLLIAALKKRRTSVGGVRPTRIPGHVKISHEKKAKPAPRKVGNTDAVCPHCSGVLEKKPGRKKKCPHCGQFIFVRTRPADKQRVLVTEAQAEEIEEQWSIANGTHGEYLAGKQRIADEKAKLARRCGRQPSESEVAWSLLNQELATHASRQDWGLFRNAKMQMADILRKESKLNEALEMYCEVCYLDLNGPNNMGGTIDGELVRYFPPWNPNEETAFLAPGVIERIARLIDKAGIDEREMKDTFVVKASKLRTSLRLPVPARSAWLKMREALY